MWGLFFLLDTDDGCGDRRIIKEVIGSRVWTKHGRRQGYSPVCHGIPKILEINTNAYMYTYKYNVYSCYMV